MEDFIKNKDAETVTGIRRMGRINMVNCLAKIASMNGYVTSIYPDIKSDSDIILFEHWSGMIKPAKELKTTNPHVDIFYGQDLCHQVPAIVRWNENE